MSQIETAGFHEPPSIYTTLASWMRHREAMWRRLDAISDPDEKRIYLKEMREDRLIFEAETRRHTE